MALDVIAFSYNSYLCFVRSVRQTASSLDEESTADKRSFAYMVLRFFPLPRGFYKFDSYFMEHETAEGVQLPVS